MKSEESTLKPVKQQRRPGRLKLWSGLQAHMTISYVGTTVLTALLLELVIGLIILVILTRSPLLDFVISNTANHTARAYALKAAVQAGGTALNPQTTFQPGQPASIALAGENPATTPGSKSSPYIPFLSEEVPYIDPHSTPSQVPAFALLIAPDSQVIASSYPALYPASKPVARVLPGRTQLILDALAGKAGSMVEDTPQGRFAYAAQPVLSKAGKTLGVVYVQVPFALSDNAIFWNIAGGWLRSGAPWLIIMIPIGTIFGIFTTRSLVRRIHRLAKTTTRFAAGDYEQRLPALETDEVGLLEQSFNQMADQLIESMAQRQVLIEQNARQAERARIEQEMHTAHNIQQALLPKGTPGLAGWQIVPYYQPAREVGGDFYDFFTFEDGRLGIVIGDVSGKGVPAALVMAITRTMLRTAAQPAASPGDVLVRVNELLSADIPPGMFVTCFYALLNPESGHLHFANAGHDLPYKQHGTGIAELHARGMPLGMLPGSTYEEQEASLAPGDCVLFYSDGLVEAHNQKRDMFGLPRLVTLLEERQGDTRLIDFLLGELASFTGTSWEQEDDVTMVVLRRASSLPAEDSGQAGRQIGHLLEV